MADLPSGPLVKINDIEVDQTKPITEALMSKFGVNVNGLIATQIKTQTFTSGGTWTAPTVMAVTQVMVIGRGGSGGGAGGDGAGTSRGGSGGGGACSVLKIVTVTPGASYAVTIGAGGAGGTANNPGGTGGTTSFGSLVNFLGAQGGGDPDFAQDRGGLGIGMGGNGGGGSVTATTQPAENSPFAPAGTFFGGYDDGGAGGGGDGPGGNGGNGPDGGAPGSPGTNGGGGGGGGDGSTGGAGTAGLLTVIWFGG